MHGWIAVLQRAVAVMSWEMGFRGRVEFGEGWRFERESLRFDAEHWTT